VIDCSQFSVPGSAATSLGVIPPGAASILLVNGSGTIPVYVGSGVAQPGTASPLTGCGCPIPGGAVVSLAQYPPSSASHLWAQASSGTVSVGLVVSNGA
jgi:hypothetical protein